ncbi:MAG: gamma-glutamyl-gamma-aminobutyrate hydrolase family protein [Nitrospirae bacterium]|nr:gamma-glutamyl-gamma-aminobutyrate hydrolase family protein [Nitrospirota bacterium]
MNKPIIGITGDIVDEIYSVKISYARAMEKAGGCPVFLPPVSSKDAIKNIAGKIDALLISGGGDIHPRYYGQKKKTALKLISDERFYFERKLLEEILALNKPVLGICYGMQFLNVFFGGTLYQDLNLIKTRDMKIDHNAEHKIRFYNQSKLYYILCKEGITVNSHHHQVINVIGKGLEASAHSVDGVIEAIELRDYPFLVGVQWHPERLLDRNSQRLFNAFIDAVI